MLVVGPVRGHLRRRWQAYAVLLGALLLTGLAWYYVTQYVAAQERARFDDTVQFTRQALELRVHDYVDAILAARGLFAASQSVRHDEWHAYVGSVELLQRYPGIRAFGYAERVGAGDTDAHVAEMRGQGFPDYTLRSGGQSSEYFPLVYVEPPSEPNRRLEGQDLYAEPAYRIALEQARDTGLPHATGKVTLEQEADASGRAVHPGFAIVLPVYRQGQPLDQATVAERRQDLEGFIVGVFDVEQTMVAVFRDQADPTVDFEIFDGEELTPDHLLYDHDRVLHSGSAFRASFSGLTTLDVAGRTWTLEFYSLPSFDRASRANRVNLPLYVALSGASVSLLLFGITWVLASSRMEAERANAELAASNQELATFSYSISHDLRAPVRQINGFSLALLEDCADQLDAEGRDYLQHIRAASQQMGELIDAMLSLARVTRSELHREPVDLTALAQSIVAGLRRGDPERAVDVVIAPDMRAQGDARLLQAVLENLLGNAWKFTRHQPGARIEFGVAQVADTPIYFVRDNGAGFDMAYADKLFAPFQRLHRASEFEGTGVGLATVQRIIRRHGGQVWAEGAVGQGATFYFTLGGQGHDRSTRSVPRGLARSRGTAGADRPAQRPPAP